MDTEKLIKSIVTMCDLMGVLCMQTCNESVDYDNLPKVTRLKYRYNHKRTLMFSGTSLGHGTICIYSDKTSISDEIVAVYICKASDNLLTTCRERGMFYGFKFKEIGQEKDKYSVHQGDHYIYF